MRPDRSNTMSKPASLSIMTCIGLLAAGAALADGPAVLPANALTPAHALTPDAAIDNGPAPRLSRAGLGSLVWASHHATNAWRIVAPIRSDDQSRMAADARRSAQEPMP
jgi:hypothetical protein